MPDLRGQRNTLPNSLSFSSFSVERDLRGGYRVELSWDYPLDESIVGFKIYKSKLSRSFLQRKYKLNQLSLERLSHSKNPSNKNSILFNKIYFSQTEKVSFNSDSNRFKKMESPISGYDYFQLAFIRTDPKNINKFIDNSVKFGETYSYFITAVSKGFRESKKAVPLFVNIEELTPTPNVERFVCSEKNSGILLQIVSPKNRDTMKYHIYRKNSTEEMYSKLAEFDSVKSVDYFLDSQVIPGNEYFYKVYSENFLGNVSWHSEPKGCEFLSNILNKGAIIDPIVSISFENKNLTIKGRKNHKDIVGYKIERKDVYNFEKRFEVKNYDKAISENVIFFDDDGNIEYNDFSIKENKIYKYRISSISKIGTVESTYITPDFVVEDGLFIQSPLYNLKENKSIKIKNFEIEPVNLLQKPIFLKISWEIEGPWNFIKLRIGKNEIKVDNIHHHIFYDQLKSGKSYEITIQAFGKSEENFSQKRTAKINI